MQMQPLHVWRVALALVALALPPILIGCGFSARLAEIQCKQLLEGEPQPPASEEQQVVVDDGRLAVYHGVACADGPASPDGYVMVSGSRALPRGITQATVFLNGWSARYASGDHHVRGVATAISGIALADGTLRWQAAGLLRDDDGSRKYGWCYRYTVVGWDPTRVALAVHHEDGACAADDPAPSSFYFTRNLSATTALATYPSFVRSPALAGSREVAVLPRGYGFGYTGDEDHHVLQLGYRQFPGEPFAEGAPFAGRYQSSGKSYRKKVGVETLLPNGQGAVGGGVVTWETQALLKDNDLRREVLFGEVVSGLAGADLGVVRPPFSLLPLEDVEGTFTSCAPETNVPAATATEEYVVENLAYEYAIPLLTGWDLSYFCDDHHVRQLGAWIHDLAWEKAPNAPGRLRYKLSYQLADDSGHRGYGRHQVTVVGVKPVAVTPVPRALPDLLPFAPDAPNPLAFCRRDGGKLRVTVKNAGGVAAPPSRTTVAFGDARVTLDTSAVPASGAVDVLFDVPPACFRPDCAFRITVDAGSAVDEGANEGNDSADGLCRG